MKEEWKVWIKGVPNRGNEVIKALTDLGAKEPFFSTSGSNDNFIHFINHKGEIDYEWLDSEQGQIIMGNYKEIKLPENQFGKWDWKPEWKWKPETGDPYWMINCNGYVDTYCWCNDTLDNSCFNFGNCFKTKEEAEAMAKTINKLLNAKV